MKPVYRQGILGEETLYKFYTLYKTAHRKAEGVDYRGGETGGAGIGKGRTWWGREALGLCLSPLGPPELCVELRSPSDLPTTAFWFFPLFPEQI